MAKMPKECQKAFQCTPEWNNWHWLKVQGVSNFSLFPLMIYDQRETLKAIHLKSISKNNLTHEVLRMSKMNRFFRDFNCDLFLDSFWNSVGEIFVKMCKGKFHLNLLKCKSGIK